MKNRGFSLIEIVVAVAIMGILSGIVGLQLRSYIAKSKDTKAVATLNTLRVAAQLYQLENEKPLIEDSSKYEDKEEIKKALEKLEPYLDNNAKAIIKDPEIAVGGSKKDKDSKRNISEEHNKIYENLKISPLKKFILKKTVSYAKKFIRLRENLRYERTKVFGMVRKIMKKMGVYLKEENIIVHERDVFYLTIDEIFGLIDGALIDTDLKKLIDLRKEKYKEYEEEAVLPDRFLTRGFLGENFHYEDLTGNEQGDKNILKGTGCSKGVVKGKVKIVLNPMNTEVEDGDIVVTKSTDPSWVMVFPLLKGLIVEKGSLLSHSAIISREMNIPAIVGVQGAVTALKTGDFVQFDGSTGIIKKLDEV